MTLLALFQVASAVVLTIAVFSGAWKKLPGSSELGRVTLAAWAFSLASSAPLLLSVSGVAKGALVVVGGVAVAVALCLTGLYVQRLGPLVTNRTDISQEAIDLYVASARWTGTILICISLALLPLALLFAFWPP
jgi:hypothetical protein